MKIALQAGAPEPDQLNAFMQAYAGSDSMAAIGRAVSSGDVIAAYDSGRLVGIGSRVQTSDEETSLAVYIAPGYERRAIRDNMAKLLLHGSGRRVPAV